MEYDTLKEAPSDTQNSGQEVPESETQDDAGDSKGSVLTAQVRKHKGKQIIPEVQPSQETYDADVTLPETPAKQSAVIGAKLKGEENSPSLRHGRKRTKKKEKLKKSKHPKLDKLEITPLNKISPQVSTYNVKVRVMRLWYGPLYKKSSNSLTFVARDEQGDDLEVIVDDSDTEKWKNIFEEDRVYLISNVDCIVAPKLVKIVRARWQLQLTKESAVYERLTVEVPSSFPYKFAKLSSIPELGEKPQYLIDVIGYVREVKPFRFVPVFGNQVRVVDFYMIDETSYDNPFEVTIWPSLLQKHEDVFLHGDGKPFFLVALSLKIRQFKKSFNLETTNFTQFIFNVDAIPPAQELMHWVMVELPKKRVSHSGSISSGQSEVNHVTINALIKATMNPPQQDKAMTFDVHARIIYISTEKPYFSACRKCGKGVQLADDMEYACPSCPHSGRDADLKFKVSCTIADETDETQICLFDRQAQLVLRLPVQQLLDMYQTVVLISDETGCGKTTQ